MTPARLPRRERFIATAAIAAGALALLGLYSRTAAPGAWWGDGLELTCAAKVLGIPHPTGYPLYMVLGHLVMGLFSQADPGRVMTLFSSTLCAAGVALIAAFLFRQRVEDDPGNDASPGNAGLQPGNTAPVLEPAATPAALPLDCPEAAAPPPDLVHESLVPPGALVSALGMMFLLGVSATLWDHATFAEVYPLTFAINALLLNLADSSGADRLRSLLPRLLLIALVSGIGTLNHYTVTAMGPVVLAALLAWGWRLGATAPSRPRRIALRLLPLAIFLLVALPCLLGYLYLPIRAATNPPINWGDPSTRERVLWVLRGGEFTRHNLTSWAYFARDLHKGVIYYFIWIGSQFFPVRSSAAVEFIGLIIFGLAAYGLVLIARRRPALGIGLMGTLFMTLIYPILYHIPDLDAYLLPSLAPLAAGVASGARALGRRARENREAFAQTRVLAPALPCLLAFALALVHYPRVNKSWDNGPEVWATTVLDRLPQGAMIITQQSNDAEPFALWYEQIVKHRRPDVTVFGAGFVFSGWYKKYFEAEGRPRVPVFITQRDPGDKSTFDIALYIGVIFPNLRERRVFTTYLDPELSDLMNPVPAARILPPSYYEACRYRLNPPGPFLYELKPDPAAEIPLRARFIETFGMPPPG